MNRQPQHYLPAFDRLEDRWVPAGNVTASVSFGTLTLTGDLLANNIDISQVGFKTYNITGNGTTVTFGGVTNAAGTPVTIGGVTNIVANMNAGDDTVTFGVQTAGTVSIVGNLTVNGGIGNNTFDATAQPLEVIGNLGITNTAGNDSNQFGTLSVGGSMTVNNGDGDSATIFNFTAINTISGNLSITNGTGADNNTIPDVNVGGNVTINDGHRNIVTGQAGFNGFGVANSGTTIKVGGSLSFTNLDGQVDDFLPDVDVKGNVAINTGAGPAQVTGGQQFLGVLPVVSGNFSITGAGGAQIQFGLAGGIQIKGGLTISETGSAASSITLNDVAVGKNTMITTGTGADTVTIDNGNAATGSNFGGAFAMNTGSGNDSVDIGIGGGEGRGVTTTFDSTVNVNLGAGNDTLNLATGGNVALFGASRFDGSTGFDTLSDVGGAIAAGRLTFVTVPNFVSFP
jgi:hypothetical protein